MRILKSDVLTNRTKASSQTFHESAFVKALADIDVSKVLVKNVKHLQTIEVYKNEKPESMTTTRTKQAGKMVVLNLSTPSLLFYYLALIFFPSHLSLRLQNGTSSNFCHTN